MVSSLKSGLLAALFSASIPATAIADIGLVLDGINGESGLVCAVSDCSFDPDTLRFTISQPEGRAQFSPLVFSATVGATGADFLRLAQATGGPVRATLHGGTSGAWEGDVWVDGRIITADSQAVDPRRFFVTLGDINAVTIHWRPSHGDLFTGGWGLGGDPAFSGDPEVIDGLLAFGAQRLGNGDLQISLVPEPGTWAMWLVGALGLGLTMLRARPR